MLTQLANIKYTIIMSGFVLESIQNMLSDLQLTQLQLI